MVYNFVEDFLYKIKSTPRTHNSVNNLEEGMNPTTVMDK